MGVDVDLASELLDYLRTAHALEQVELRVLEAGARTGGDRTTGEIYRAHAIQTRGHLRLVEERLGAHGAAPAAPDLPGLPAMSDPPVVPAVPAAPGLDGPIAVAGLVVTFDPDVAATPAQLAITAYALENLEIGIYHVLLGVARRLHDRETEVVALQILEQEEDAAELVAGRIDRACT